MSWLKDCLSSDSKISSKRTITLLSFLLVAIGFISNLFFGLKVEEYMFESVMLIILGGLGTTASEYFSKKKSEDPSEKDQFV